MQPAPVRQRLGSIDPNVMTSGALEGHSANSGMSAGMKVGRQGGGFVNGHNPAQPRSYGASMLGMR